MEEEKIQEQTVQAPAFSYVQELMKDRSYINCISTAYHDITAHFKPLLKTTWKYALAYALLYGAFEAAQYTEALSGGIAGACTNLLLGICWFVAMFAWGGKVFTLLNGESFRHNFGKLFKGIMVVYVIMIAALLVILAGAIAMAWGSKDVTKITLVVSGAVALWLLFLAVYATPLGYSVVRYMMVDGTVKHMLGSDWKRGFRHWGFIFATWLVISIITAVVVGIVGTPFFILAFAGHLSGVGVAAGDAANLPSAMFIPVWFCAALMMLCNAFFTLWQAFTFYYVYGTIETREKEKNETENTIY